MLLQRWLDHVQDQVASVDLHRFFWLAVVSRVMSGMPIGATDIIYGPGIILSERSESF